MIMGGVGLMSAKNLLLALPSIDPALVPALEKQRSAFKTIGWSYIIMFIVTIIIMVVYFAAIIAMISSMKGMRTN